MKQQRTRSSSRRGDVDNSSSFAQVRNTLFDQQQREEDVCVEHGVEYLAVDFIQRLIAPVCGIVDYNVNLVAEFLDNLCYKPRGHRHRLTAIRLYSNGLHTPARLGLDL